PAGYPTKDAFNLVKGDSLYIAGEITPHLGAWVEIGGWNDHGDAASLAGYNVILNGGDHTVDNKNFTYGLSFENMVGFDDVGQAGPGNWGVPDQLNPLSTHNTLFDPFDGNSTVEGAEAYAMLGNFTNGGIYGNIGLYAPSNGNDEGTPPVDTAGGSPGNGSWHGAKHADVYADVEYWLPGFKNIYSMIGAFGYFPKKILQYCALVLETLSLPCRFLYLLINTFSINYRVDKAL
ncbi:MAG: hypothetical protein ACP5S8_08455, partial [Hydrogenobaculum sp.]